MYFLGNAFSEHQNHIRFRESEENSIALAKYLSTRISRPKTSTNCLSHFQNSQAPENTAAVSSSRRNSATIEDEDFHFSDYLNNSGSGDEY